MEPEGTASIGNKDPSNCHTTEHTKCKVSAARQGPRKEKVKRDYQRLQSSVPIPRKEDGRRKCSTSSTLNDNLSQLDRPRVMRVIVNYLHHR
ncbi:hypothetical protein M408DRAFT_131744 [Serendipita vermifera MAFF 305830]|uniref:Uncharacterized protein n=1 Tax=Serendipita vermifera MAFF 305830 TaxID=933852 RepID=A0A0C3AW15_SERVB|nr:hypothetical protein M408DRAFT_131744 [Serendipita vermifera MAFF 305830]